jgi:hypothetical protein
VAADQLRYRPGVQRAHREGRGGKIQAVARSRLGIRIRAFDIVKGQRGQQAPQVPDADACTFLPGLQLQYTVAGKQQADGQLECRRGQRNIQRRPGDAAAIG